MKSKVKFSPLALSQLDNIWDYGFQRFGAKQADKYLDELLDALDDIAETWTYSGLKPRLFPNDKIADFTSEHIHFTRFENEILYFKKLKNGERGVISILGVRMDTPNRFKEMLANPLSEI
ncbi:MAG: type II toxin-antitoxin system RelE/ParE family toxin [Hahellaceae bacterium]|nr:type II toxin-antitoxin system RelE/ParE family toxin [Hahellaceae bacterium]